MRHLLVAAALLLAAFIVTLGAATVLENMASQRQPEPDSAPFIPGGTAPQPAAAPQQGRSLSIVTRRG
jgi:hypothetical protein